jgi:hypothetical protein
MQRNQQHTKVAAAMCDECVGTTRCVNLLRTRGTRREQEGKEEDALRTGVASKRRVAATRTPAPSTQREARSNSKQHATRIALIQRTQSSPTYLPASPCPAESNNLNQPVKRKYGIPPQPRHSPRNSIGPLGECASLRLLHAHMPTVHGMAVVLCHRGQSSSTILRPPLRSSARHHSRSQGPQLARVREIFE